MNKCPNPAYGGIECFYALFDGAPVPCFATQEQCDQWRKQKTEKAEIKDNKVDNAIDQLEL